MNEQELCKKRLLDLSRQANRKGIVLFSDFLNLNELNIYHQCQKLLESKTESYGGIPYAERQIIAFIPDALYYEWNYPITALQIVPTYPKFAEKLEHRDILGALMQLGVERSRLGDILLNDGEYYLLCQESIAPYFIENVSQIRHTVVSLKEVPLEGLSVSQNLLEREGIVTSSRLDAVLACVHKLSRSQAQMMIRGEKVFVNGASMQNFSYQCKAGDIISLRGYGRFIYSEEYGETNKGRLKIRYQLYQ